MEPGFRSQISELEHSLPPLSLEQSLLLEQAAGEIPLSDIAEQVLKAGITAPDFTLPNCVGMPVSLAAALESGPVLVTFYRGAWCPCSSLQLRAYQKILPEIIELGASMLAVSQHCPNHSQARLLKNFLKYEVLSDLDNIVARQYGLVYTVPDWMRALYISFGADLTACDGDTSWELPIPGTFVIGRKHRILHAFADSDINSHLEATAILEALKTAS